MCGNHYTPAHMEERNAVSSFLPFRIFLFRNTEKCLAVLAAALVA
jgi:hypothetical protein